MYENVINRQLFLLEIEMELERFLLVPSVRECDIYWN